MSVSAVVVFVSLLAPFRSFAQAPADSLTVEAVVIRANQGVVQIRTYDGAGQQLILGSGFVAPDGRVVTTAHLVAQASRVDVLGSHGEVLLTTKNAEVLHPILDIAVLPVVPGRSKLALSSATPSAGDQVVALGSANGVAYLAGTGTVSGMQNIGGRSVIQISAPLSNGYSGGPVLNRAAEVIGMIVSVPAQGQAVSQTVPSQTIQAVLKNPASKIALATFVMPAPVTVVAVADSGAVKSKTAAMVDSTAAPAAAPAVEAAASVRAAIALSPAYAELHVRLGNILLAEKRPGEALAAYRDAISIKPILIGANAGIAEAFAQLDKPDSVATAIQAAMRAGDDRPQLASIAFKTAGNSYRKGTELKSRVSLAQALTLLLLSDQLQTSADAKFLAGMSAFLIGQSEVTEAQTTHQCTTIQDAMKSFAQAIQYLPAGSGVYPEAKQTLTASGQFSAAASDMAGRYCK